MEKTNKKQNEILIVTVIILLLVFLTVSLLVYFLYKPNNTDPNITQETIWEETSGDIYNFTENDASNYTITGIKENAVFPSEYIILPSTYDGRSVTSIAENSFSNTPNVKGIVIPENINSIAENAFSGNEEVEIIGIGVQPENINFVTLTSESNNVITIGDNAFSGCNNLKTFLTTSSVKELGKNVFDGCLQLTDISMPNVTVIDQTTFDSQNSLLKINETNMPKLNSMVVRPDTEENALIFNKSISRIEQNIGVIIEEGVESLYTDSFVGYTNINSVDFPTTIFNKIIDIINDVNNGIVDSNTGNNSINEIFTSLSTMFNGCVNISSLKFFSNTSDQYYGMAFYEVLFIIYDSIIETQMNIAEQPNLDTLIIKEGSTGFFQRSVPILTTPYLKNLILPTTMESIPAQIFSGVLLDSIYIPANVNSIGENAFAVAGDIIVDNENQYYYSINNALIQKSDKKLILVSNATESIPDDGSVEIIGKYSLYNLQNDTINIPSSVKSIESFPNTFSVRNNISTLIIDSEYLYDMMNNVDILYQLNLTNYSGIPTNVEYIDFKILNTLINDSNKFFIDYASDYRLETINEELYSVYSTKSQDYNIIYNLNGGELSNPITTYNYKTETFTLQKPYLDGYYFVGWLGTNLDEETKDVVIDKYSTGNREYTAVWIEAVDYSIKYELNGGELENPVDSYNYETETFELPQPTKEGLTFKGWIGQGIDEPTKIVIVDKYSTGNRVYTAVWGLAVTLVVDGISTDYFVEENQTVVNIIPTSLNSNNICGWYADSQLTQPVNSLDFTITSSVTYFTKKATLSNNVFEFILNNDGNSYSVRRNAFSLYTTELVVPLTYNNKPVTKWLRDTVSANLGATKITELYLTENITDIADYAFQYNRLTTITLPSSLINIGDYILDNTTITELIINFNSSTNINKNAFSKFSGGINLTNLIFGEGVTSIDMSKFINISNIESLSLPSTLENIILDYANSVKVAPKIQSIVINSNNKNYSVINNCIIDNRTNTLILGCDASVLSNDMSVQIIGNSAFKGTSISQINIPETVTKIEESAFARCNNLTEIYIPSSVSIVEYYAFGGCNSLTKVIIDSADIVENYISNLGISSTTPGYNVTDVYIKSDLTITEFPQILLSNFTKQDTTDKVGYDYWKKN